MSFYDFYERKLDDLLDELEEARATKKDKFEILSIRLEIKAIARLMASEVKEAFYWFYRKGKIKWKKEVYKLLIYENAL